MPFKDLEKRRAYERARYRARRGRLAAGRVAVQKASHPRLQSVPADFGLSSDDYGTRERCAAELAERRAKPRPEARPPPDQSAALRALRRSLASAREPALRARLEAAIAAIVALYRPEPEKRPAAVNGRSAKSRNRTETPRRPPTRQRPPLARRGASSISSGQAA